MSGTHTGMQPGWTDYGLLCLLAFIWGGSFMLARVAVTEVPPITLTALRQTIATAVFLLAVYQTGQMLRASGSDHFKIFLSAIFGIALPFSLIHWGLEEVNAGFAAILMGLMPLFTIVFAHLFTQDEKMDSGKIMGVFLGIGGLIVLFWPSIVSTSDVSTWRQLAVIGASLSYAVNALITKRLVHLPPLPMFAVNMSWTLVLLGPAALLLEPGLATMPSLKVIGCIVLLGILPSAVASLLMFRIIARQGASFFGQINLLVPVAGVIWGAAVLGERLSPHAFVALAIILSGVAVSRMRRKQRLNTIEESTS